MWIDFALQHEPPTRFTLCFQTYLASSILRKKRRKRLATAVIYCILAAGAPSPSAANEWLRIAGMGGTRIATQARDAGIFGNPASLVNVQNHNVAVGIASENLRWGELPKPNTAQFVAEANMDVYPSSYYSHAFGEWGVSVGYAAMLTNFANFTVAATRAEYDTNARQFSSQTELITDYVLFHEGSGMLGLSRHIGESVVGARLKWVSQDVKRGEVISTLNLSARHGPDVDVQTPEQLIESIVTELQFGDRVREIIHAQHPTIDRIGSRLELDIGFQREVWLGSRHSKPIQVGVIFENILRADLVEPLPFQFGIGFAYEPLGWLLLAADTWRATGQRGINFAIGAEFHAALGKRVERRETQQIAAHPSDEIYRVIPDLSCAPISPQGMTKIALRIGAGRVDTTPHLAVGFALTHGTLSAEYTFSRTLAYQPALEARHMVAFTLHF